MKIGKREIGSDQPVFVVAELSANHAGSLAKAHALIDAAHHAGADAIKLQTFRPDELAELRGGRDKQAEPPWNHFTLGELYALAQTPWEWHRELFDHAQAQGMEAFSSTFSKEATAFLISLNVPAVKIAAREWILWDSQMLGPLKNVPIIASVQPDTLVVEGYDDVALLHCVSAYPARCEAMRLSRMTRLLDYAPAVGLSDHSLCPATPIMAVALGAKIIEVHLMLNDRDYETPPLDAGHSWRPEAFAQLVKDIRHAEATL